MDSITPPKKLPVHSLGKNEYLVFVKEIQHKNPYDFTQVHRHDYYEIFFFENGGGSQLTDFMAQIPIELKLMFV